MVWCFFMTQGRVSKSNVRSGNQAFQNPGISKLYWAPSRLADKSSEYGFTHLLLPVSLVVARYCAFSNGDMAVQIFSLLAFRHL